MADTDGAPDRAASEERTATSLQRSARLFPAVVRREFKSKSSTTPFLIWVSFLLSFSLSRLYVILAGSASEGRGDTSQVSFAIGQNIIIAGYHVHHIAIGVLLLAVAGWLGLHYRGRQIARTSALMYGIGLGFIIDEVGFLIGNIRPYRGDVETFYIAIAIGALLMSAVYFPRFWRSVREDVRGVATLMYRLPSLNRPRSVRDGKEVDKELEQVLGPPTGETPAPIQATPAVPPPPSAIAEPRIQRRDHDTETETGGTARFSVDRDTLFSSLLAKVVDVMLIIIFLGLLLGLAKLILSLPSIFLGLSVRTMMQPILTGILTLLIGVELFRAMLEFMRSSRIMLPFLVDAGILLGLRELTIELSARAPEPVLVAVIGGTLVALGGLRVFLVKTMLPGRGPVDPYDARPGDRS